MLPVEIFILEQPENLRPSLKKLRSIILSSSPFIIEKLVYGIPFFYGNKRIFYLNPQVDWIDLGFCFGHLLGENSLLETKDRTQVKTIRFHSVTEIETAVLLPIIHEAILIDQLNNKKKKIS